jgi:hypothetical protein
VARQPHLCPMGTKSAAAIVSGGTQSGRASECGGRFDWCDVVPMRVCKCVVSAQWATAVAEGRRSFLGL